MATFGRYTRFPLRFGGGGKEHRDEHEAILQELSAGYDVQVGTALWCETYALARAIAGMWAASIRRKNQALPLRMQDVLADWEQACGLVPTIEDEAVVRRQRVAAKLRGLAGNTMVDIGDMCTAMLGQNFEAVVVVATANVISYAPGGPALVDGAGTALCTAPGPPGLEWSTNRVRVGIRLNKAAISDAEWIDKRARLAAALDAMLPSWMTYQIGVGSGFTINQGVLGQTFL